MSHETTIMQKSDRVNVAEYACPHSPHANKIFQDAYNIYSGTMSDAGGYLRQAAVVLDGVVVGGIKDIPQELKHHRLEADDKAGLALVSGIIFSKAVQSRSPWIAGGALFANGILAGYRLFKTGTKLRHDPELVDAMNAVRYKGDAVTMYTSMQKAEQRLGPLGFGMAIGTMRWWSFWRRINANQVKTLR